MKKLIYQKRSYILLGMVVLLFIAALIYSLLERNALSSTRQALLEKSVQIGSLSSQVTDLKKQVADLENENSDLSDKYKAKEELTDSLQNQVEQITKTVGSISDYALADPELLKKYSSVYFLNENYAPPKLADIPEEYHYDPNKDLQVRSEVLPFLDSMLGAAEKDGVDLEVVSAYRSFGEQEDLKGRYVVTYGRDTANTFSADQGYSEHQLGTTVDLTTQSLGADFDTFDTTDGYTWMTSNAYKYGFVLSYPKNNPYYEYEPWHWRFVGIKLATDLHNADAYFYDWGQRDLDNYRGEIFDNPPQN